MNSLDWIAHRLEKEGFTIPLSMQGILSRGKIDQGPFYFDDREGAVEDTERMNSLFKSRQVVTFGRRRDYDGVLCIVVSDGDYPRGHVLVLHWDGWPGTEVDEDHPSLADWAEAAEAEIAEHAAYALAPPPEE